MSVKNPTHEPRVAASAAPAASGAPAALAPASASAPHTASACAVSAASASASAVAAATARDAYGRMLAHLAYRWRDIAAAQDALAEAFASALTTWPKHGVPDSPQAWLMTAAQRNLAQAYRHLQVREDPRATILIGETEAQVSARDAAPLIPDDRLKLLFVCAHPAIDASVRSALMLQTVLGLDATQIASAFLTSPAAMAQRLVRAKKKITQAGIRFEEPCESELPERTHAVCEAIYAAYFLGSTGAVCRAGARVAAPADAHQDLREEAIYLADLAATLLPESAEAAGLLALLLLCEARQAARSTPTGAFIPLIEQDTAAWDKPLIDRANQILWHAQGLRQIGPFQLEAAIQAAHCQRLYTGQVPWALIALLYGQLLALSPTLGAQVGHAVALGETHGHARALQALAQIAQNNPTAVANYQPFWAASAYWQANAGLGAQARVGYGRAMGLATSPALRAYLAAQSAQLDAQTATAPELI